MTQIIFFLLFVIMYLLNTKTYSIKVESAGYRIPELQQALKIEMETTLHEVKMITESTPYLVGGYNYLECRSIVKHIRKYGGVASIHWKWFWSKPAYGHIS